MDRLCDKPLSGPRFSRQENRAVGPRDGLDHLEHVEHRFASADDVGELVRQPERPLEQHVFLPEVPALDLLADLHLEQVDLERLAQIVAGAQPHCLDRRLGRRKGRDHDAQDVRIDALGGAQDLDAAHVSHLDVGDQQIDAFPLQNRDRGGAGLGEQDVVPLAFQNDREQLAHRSLVVDDEDPRQASAGRRGRRCRFARVHALTVDRTGRRTETVVPPPLRELTWISP